MSDDAEQHWNAWVGTYGNNNTIKLLCRWHIDRAWRKAITERMHDKDDQLKVYHFLQVLLSESDQSQFQVSLQQLISITSRSFPNFHHYFETYYCHRLQEGTTCYRKRTFINTNMFNESFNNILKTVYLNNKHNRRLDHLVSVLLKIARDNAFG